MTTHRVWNIGFDDHVRIVWMRDGLPVDYHEDKGQPITHYCDLVRDRDIDRDSIDHVPPCAAQRSWRNGCSIVDVMRATGLNPQVMPRLPRFDTVNAPISELPQRGALHARA